MQRLKRKLRSLSGKPSADKTPKEAAATSKKPRKPKDKSKQLCPFLSQEGGCKKGAACDYKHAQQMAATVAPATVDQLVDAIGTDDQLEADSDGEASGEAHSRPP